MKKINRINPILYLIAVLILLVPTVIVLISDTVFSSTISSTLITLATLFLIAGKTLTAIQKKRESKPVSFDIGIIFGCAFSIITRLF